MDTLQNPLRDPCSKPQMPVENCKPQNGAFFRYPEEGAATRGPQFIELFLFGSRVRYLSLSIYEGLVAHVSSSYHGRLAVARLQLLRFPPHRLGTAMGSRMSLVAPCFRIST